MKQMLAVSIAVLAVLLGLYRFMSTGSQRYVDKENDTIVITGTSSGIGKHAALAMNAIGFTVYAGVRKMKDGEAVKEMAMYPDKFIPVQLDVTNHEQIAEAVKLIESEVGEKGLTALYNNAGVSGFGYPSTSIELYPEDMAKWVMDVNYFGMRRVTKAFLPLLKKAGDKGRIIFNTSMYGFFSPPFTSHYSATKFATEALADALRNEIYIYGLKVSIIEPGYIYSDMTCLPPKVVNKEEADGVKPYRDEAAGYGWLVDTFGKPELCSDDLIDAVLNSKPEDRYFMGGWALKSWILSKLPSEFGDYVWQNPKESKIEGAILDKYVAGCATPDMFDVTSYAQKYQ